MSEKNLLRPKVLSLIATFILYVICPLLSQSAMAAEAVHGQYVQTSGDIVTLHITVSNPAPPNLILEQYFPPGTKVLSTSPKARKIDSQSGMVKWLFKSVSPGRIIVTMRIEPAIAKRSVNATLLYRSQRGGMTEHRISR
jgi:hypothetical protein